MTSLEQALLHETNKWAQKSYTELRADDRDWPLHYEDDLDGFRYYAEVDKLEETEKYIHIGIGVDDGGLRALVPLTSSILIYADGRVDA